VSKMRKGCDLCGSFSESVVNERMFRNQMLRWRKFNVCSLIFQDAESYADAKEFMQSNEYLESTCRGYADYLSISSEHCRRRQSFRLVEKIARYCGLPSKAMEIGAATGTFVKALRENGVDCTGMDFSPVLVKAAKEMNGVDIVNNDFMDAALPTEAYDAVFLFGTVGTVSSIKMLMEKIVRILKPSGLFVFNYMNYNHFSRKLLGKRYHRQTISSRYRLTGTTISRYLDAAGMRLLYDEPDYKWTTVGSLAGYLRSNLVAKIIAVLHIQWIPLMVPVPGGRIVFSQKALHSRNKCYCG